MKHYGWSQEEVEDAARLWNPKLVSAFCQDCGEEMKLAKQEDNHVVWRCSCGLVVNITITREGDGAD